MWILLAIVLLILLILLLRTSYREPRIIRGMISDEECEHIKKMAMCNLSPSTISQDKIRDTTVRKSETAWLNSPDERIISIINRCLERTNKTIDHCESLQVLRYKPGGFYKPHQDANKEQINMRAHTFILILNDEYEGGETEFPNLGKKYRLNKGDALFFDTLDRWGSIPDLALHGGRPVVSGEKWIANLWIHQSPYA